MNFYLLHLSLMREYLNLEFHDVESALTFDYNLERIIDDFILLAVFVGNDFLPHLPDLHIHENGLEKLFEAYKKVLPSLGTCLSRISCGVLIWLVTDGYVNESGTINVKRLQILLGEMTQWEQEVFEREYSDMGWFKGKQAKYVQEAERERKRLKLGSLVYFISLDPNFKISFWFLLLFSFDAVAERYIRQS
jgi:5'-3' exoribonuclease 1